MLAVENLSFSYRPGNRIVSGLQLDLRRGEVVSLLGPSGCGKSTILRLVAGLLTPDRGDISWESGRIPEIGFVFQQPALMPWKSVTGNVALPHMLRRKHMPPAALDGILESVGLDGMRHRYPETLSGGQQMRVSIARAMAAEPELLLMDEPFAALDEILRFRMNELMLELSAEKNWSILFVTHSLFEAVYLSDRVLVLDDGRIAGQVTPALDRTLSGSDQRASKRYLAAVRQVGSLLEAGRQVHA